MTQSQALIAELQMEAASTRRILARVPFDNSEYTPHPKSQKLVKLAAHIAEIPGWITLIMTQDELDFAKNSYKPETPANTEELIAILDKHVNAAVATLEKCENEDFGKMWTLRNGEHIMFTLPKAAVVRSFAMSHGYHHRAQLGVYLRLLDIPLPGMYGPTADDVPAQKAEPATA